ncbi:hypothetical protein BDP27DRAFT_911682 [Rhodocollybia butyracea]|uniref:NAD(P)-binding protein n=1 Tax=Rhodocollybia butyracea TaxID=206335 RepID=A0A9P5P565_9AGAR|nr:hypothetical protein BDP27DRAFT_911682 [Rhodocollybia butyracea]
MFRAWNFLVILPLLFALRKLSRKQRRQSIISQSDERVLILGASSGIGRRIAHKYALRGARVCVVGRRDDKVTVVVKECETDNTIGITADFGNVGDMIRVRSKLEKEWAGIDTVVVAAGVSALRPLLEVAGVNSEQNSDASEAGIKFAVNAAEAAIKGNYIGPMVAAITFIPLLRRTSRSPSILLISSLGAVIPAPTRSMYGSTKSASLLLYQALAIEHPSIKFSFVLPSTVEGDFRASAVDQLSSTIQASDHTPTDSKSALQIDDVAQRCIQAVDQADKVIFMPGTMRLGHLLYWLWPSFVEKKAMEKYNFTAD